MSPRPPPPVSLANTATCKSIIIIHGAPLCTGILAKKVKSANTHPCELVQQWVGPLSHRGWSSISICFFRFPHHRILQHQLLPKHSTCPLSMSHARVSSSSPWRCFGLRYLRHTDASGTSLTFQPSAACRQEGTRNPR